MKNIKVNKAQCKICGDTIISTHVHDYKHCKCGEITVDGGKEYLRRGWKDPHNFIELSEYYTEEETKAYEEYKKTDEYKEKLARQKQNFMLEYLKL